jgi:hypothetical protein
LKPRVHRTPQTSSEPTPSRLQPKVLCDWGIITALFTMVCTCVDWEIVTHVSDKRAVSIFQAVQEFYCPHFVNGITESVQFQSRLCSESV